MEKALNDQAMTVGVSETAERLGVTPETLANWRYRGFGPRFIRVGGRVRYRLSDIATWLDDQTRTSTSDGGSYE